MRLTLDLSREIESRLLAQAHARGISLSDRALEVLTQAAEATASDVCRPQADNLYDLFAPIRGLLTDEEVDRYFRRARGLSRQVDFA